MNNSVEQWTWEAVLDAYVAAAEAPSHALLTEWIRQFPQYRQELTDFTVAWSRLAHTMPAIDVDFDEENFVLRGMSIVQNLLHQQSETQAPPATSGHPLGSILLEARQLRWPLDAFIARLELSRALLAKLDRRLIEYVTIPMQLIENLARALKRDVLSVSRYLMQPSTLAPDASYRAEQAPAVPAKEDFFDAVRNDSELDEGVRRRWLALETAME
jgi:hypothetical protein